MLQLLLLFAHSKILKSVYASFVTYTAWCLRVNLCLFPFYYFYVFTFEKNQLFFLRIFSSYFFLCEKMKNCLLIIHAQIDDRHRNYVSSLKLKYHRYSNDKVAIKKNGSVVEQPNYTHFISCTGTHWARSKYEKNVIWFQVSLSKIAAALYFLLSVSPLLPLLSSSLRCVHLHLFTLVVSSVVSFCPTELCHMTLVLRLKTETMQTIYTKFANAVCPVAAAWKAYF